MSHTDKTAPYYISHQSPRRKVAPEESSVFELTQYQAVVCETALLIEKPEATIDDAYEETVQMMVEGN